jgi:hypothetical protein
LLLIFIIICLSAYQNPEIYQIYFWDFEYFLMLLM